MNRKERRAKTKQMRKATKTKRDRARWNNTPIGGARPPIVGRKLTADQKAEVFAQGLAKLMSDVFDQGDEAIILQTLDIQAAVYGHAAGRSVTQHVMAARAAHEQVSAQLDPKKVVEAEKPRIVAP